MRRAFLLLLTAAPAAAPSCGASPSTATQLDIGSACSTSAITCYTGTTGEPDQRFAGVAPGIDLVVRERTSGASVLGASACGCSSGSTLARRSIAAGDTKDYRFFFVTAGTDTPVVLASTQITFADIERVGSVPQRVYVWGATSYILHASSDLDVDYRASENRYYARTKPSMTSGVSSWNLNLS